MRFRVSVHGFESGTVEIQKTAVWSDTDPFAPRDIVCSIYLSRDEARALIADLRLAVGDPSF